MEMKCKYFLPNTIRSQRGTFVNLALEFSQTSKPNPRSFKTFMFSFSISFFPGSKSRLCGQTRFCETEESFLFFRVKQEVL